MNSNDCCEQLGRKGVSSHDEPRNVCFSEGMRFLSSHPGPEEPWGIYGKRKEVYKNPFPPKCPCILMNFNISTGSYFQVFWTLFITEANAQGFFWCDAVQSSPGWQEILEVGYKGYHTVSRGNSWPHLPSPQILTWTQGISSRKRGVLAGAERLSLSGGCRSETQSRWGAILVSAMGQMQECDHLPVMLCSSSLDTVAKHRGEDGFLLASMGRWAVGQPWHVQKSQR